MAARGGFSSKLGFIAAAAGSAVGLGNIWKFPFEVGAGGGAAFLIMYLLFCFVLCFPVMVTEIAIGRKTQLNPVGAFQKLGFRKWKALGLLGIISGILILSFYNVVAGWAFGYFLEIASTNFEIGNQFSEFTNNVIEISLYGILFMSATAFIVSKGIAGGIEKAAKILMPTLVIMIISLVIYALTLPNAFKGIEFYLVPDFSEINLEVVFNALGQAFFSLSLGMGALITYGSYVGKSDNIITSAAWITLADVGIAFIAGLMMFPFVAYLTNGTMEGAAQGAGLIFVVLPGVFESLGVVLGAFIGGLFFLLLSFAALTSTVSLLEVPVAYIVDQFKVKRNYAVWGMAILIFLLGLPSMLSMGSVEFLTSFITYPSGEVKSFMDFIENIASDTFLPLGGFFITVFGAYIWKKHNLDEEITQGFEGYTGSFVKKYLDITLLFVCPVILGLIFLFTVAQKFFGIDILELVMN
jgi:NSS family neurotransmitter:Na+ symporter